MSDCAPVFIPTLCRYEHFKKCIDSLSRNPLAIQTHLFIALDYPLNETHEDGYSKILNYIDTIGGFKEITLIKRLSNYGAVKNSNEGVNEVFTCYDRIIFSEDDNEFSPNFLAYVNQGLEKYVKNPQVYAISGYNYPINIDDCEQTSYLNSAYSAWGVGLWRSKYFELICANKFSKEFACQILCSYSLSFKILNNKARILNALLQMVHQKDFHGDTIIESYLILENKYSLFPVLSKVRNLGHDGTGVNCSAVVNDFYSVQKNDLNLDFNFNDDVDSNVEKSVAKSLSRFNGQTPYLKIKVLFKYLKYRFSF